MLTKITRSIARIIPTETVSAHCDGPCGVYDPASARIAGEAVLSMTKKMLALDPGAHDHATQNTYSRFIAIKEEQAQLAKDELLILWTDYFKPVHLEKYPDLHTTFWNAAKLCSATKVNVSLEDAEALMDAIQKIHTIFWETKGREVDYYTAA
ncbi:MAG TPA: superoxide dismutase, Ni [Anaerolineales bacterium]|nr:superoxide dismutase, Ni [Anaerolineales bacterium]